MFQAPAGTMSLLGVERCPVWKGGSSVEVA
jgi:hypothetical protein